MQVCVRGIRSSRLSVCSASLPIFPTSIKNEHQFASSTQSS
jgi:hypothetical protein